MNNLKRIFIAIALVISTFSVANAQFRYGIKAGLNINKIHFNNDFTTDQFNAKNSLGWNAGVMAEFTVPVIGVGFDASVMYSKMNSKLDDNITINEGDATTTDIEEDLFGKSFLEIPINIKYKLTIPAVADLVKPYIYTGPSFAFKLDKNISDNFKTKTCQVAWNVGLGIELFNHLQVGAGYNFGINNIMDKFTSLNVEKIKAKNNYWTITAAYLF